MISVGPICLSHVVTLENGPRSDIVGAGGDGDQAVGSIEAGEQF